MPVPENAQVGWEIYKASDFEATLSEINDELMGRELAPVSIRMYSHYRKLRRHGYEQYIAINQLDVRTMEDPVWDRALRGRYPLHQVDEGVRVLLLQGDEAVELAGVAEEVSDGEIILRLPGGVAVTTFDAAKGSIWTIEVVFTATGEVRLAEVLKITLDRRRQRVTLRATFSGIDAGEDVLSRQVLSTSSFNVVLGTDPRSPLLGRTAQQMFWLFSGTEGVRIAALELLREVDTERGYTVPANRVERLSVASPLDAVIVVAGPVLVGIGILLTKVIEARKSWWEGTKAKHEASVAEEEVLRLRWERARRAALDEIDVRDVARAIHDSLRAELGVSTDSANPPEDGPAIKALTTQALPAVAELVEAADGDVLFPESPRPEDRSTG